jgi:hypothetical protein
MANSLYLYAIKVIPSADDSTGDADNAGNDNEGGDNTNSDTLKLTFEGFEAKEYTSDIVSGIFTIKATDHKSGESNNQSVTIEAVNDKTINKVTYKARLKSNGNGKKNYRSIVFTTTSKADLYIACASSSGGSSRTLKLSILDSSGNETNYTGTVYVDGTETPCSNGEITIDGNSKGNYISLELASAATYCIYPTTNGAVNFYEISVKYSSTDNSENGEGESGDNNGGTENPGSGEGGNGGTENPGSGDNNNGGTENPGSGDDSNGGTENPGSGDDSNGETENPGSGDDSNGGTENPGSGDNNNGGTENPTTPPSDSEEEKNEPIMGEVLKYEVPTGFSYTYTGSAIAPEVVVTDINTGYVLVKDVDYTVKYANNVNASTDATENKQPKITITCKGNYTGSENFGFVINKKNIADDDIAEGTICIEKGSKATPILVYGSGLLTKSDYTVDNADKKYNSNSTLRVRGKGNYTGTRDIAVTVVNNKNKLKKIAVEIGKETLTYNGSEQKISFVVTDASTNEPLEENTQYIAVYPDNITDVGTVRFTVVGTGDYTGAVTKTYKINPNAVKVEGKISVEGVSSTGYAFSGTSVTINDDMKVIYNNGEKRIKLTEGVDYKVSYRNNKKIGTATYKLTMMGNYKGSTPVVGTFDITAAALDNYAEGLQLVIPDKVYKKSGVYKSTPYVSMNGSVIKASNYTVSYYTDSEMKLEMNRKNRITVGDNETSATVYVKITGKGNYAGTELTGEYRVTKASEDSINISNARVTIVDQYGNKTAKLSYTGKEVTPSLKVEVKSGKSYRTLTEEEISSALDIRYVNNINKGKATVVINAKADSGYIGSRTASFNIVTKSIKK